MRSSRCNRRAGFTLIEVVVGLVLMASVLVGSLLAFSAHRQQLRHADAKVAAVAIADDLLNRFSGTREGVPSAGSGPIVVQPNWFWRTRTVGVVMPAEIPLRVIRLEVVEQNVGQAARVLARVDVVEAAI